MPLLITNTFWNYIINEDLSFLEDYKRILTKKIYNYDTNKYEYHAYYQELPFLNYMTLRFPAGLTKYLLSKTYLPIENKNKLEMIYTEEDVLKVANEVQSINPKFEIRPYQLEATLTSLNRFSSLIQSSTGSGKGQPNWLEIPTPQGFKKIGELKVGDYVFGSNGKPTKISGVFPQGKQKIYKFKFTSGKETLCDENHLWTFHYYGCKSKTYSTKELLTKNIYTIDKRGVKNYKFINELPKPIEYPEKQFDIDPYLLGVIIGDGNTTNGTVLISNPEIDKQLREFIDNKIDKTKYILKIDYHTNCPRIGIFLINKRLKKQSFFQKIKNLKLDCKSIDKFIPKQYFYGSVQQRLELLRGLMDTDGCCFKRKKHCSVTYSTSSYQLAKDIQQLVFSLGGICRFRKSDNRKTNVGYNLLIQLKVCPFNLDRKKQNWVPFIRNEHLCEISYISEDYTTCIKVEAKNELYVTSDYIVTHNTSILSLVCTILKDKNILILNGNNIILQQIYDRLISFGNTDVSWNPSKEPDYSKRIVLINTSTSDSRLNKQDDTYINFLKSVNAIIWDEAHHIQSVTSFEPIFYTDPEKLKYLIGYTASPFRNYNDPYANADDFRTIAILGEPAFKYEMKDTIQDGNIAQPYSYFIRYNNIKKDPPKQFKDNYYLQYRLNITYNYNRNKAGLEMLKFLNRNGIKTLASFSNIKPGQNMMKTLKLQGINSLFICGASTIYEWVYTRRGSLKLEKRKGSILDIKAALEGDYNLIFGSTTVDEGVDVDLFQAVVLFSAGKTPIAGLQRIGRAARKRKTGDNISFVIDFKDVGGCYIFEKQYKQRREIMEDSGIKNINNVQEFIQLIETFNR